MELVGIRLPRLLAAGLIIILAACRMTTSTPAAGTGSTSTSTAQPAATRQFTSAPTVSPTNPSTYTTTEPATAPASPTALPSPTSSATLLAEGQRIYTMGIGPYGQLIPRSEPTIGGMMGRGMMSAGGCATCHGAQGQGEQTPMFSAPNITYSNLTKPGGMIEVNGSRGPTYTDALIRRAVETGIGADGDALDTTMPRWQITDQEFAALLTYLKTLP